VPAATHQAPNTPRKRINSVAVAAVSPEEALEYERFIDVSDIISTLRLKAKRQVGDLALAQ
jgi:hypothetical protein